MAMPSALAMTISEPIEGRGAALFDQAQHRGAQPRHLGDRLERHAAVGAGLADAVADGRSVLAMVSATSRTLSPAGISMPAFPRSRRRARFRIDLPSRRHITVLSQIYLY
jgi:hypothetical protein